MEHFLTQATRSSITAGASRAVLALLLACSLALLAAYSGESAAGPLHTTQRAFLAIASPVQGQTSRTLRPFRDLATWVSGALSAQRDLQVMRPQLMELRADAIAAGEAARENSRLRALLHLDKERGLTRQHPVTAQVIGQSPGLWSATIVIDRGAASGVRVDQPVVAGEGLVGRVARVTSRAAVVSLVTDGSVAVAARVSETGVSGVIHGAARAPDDLVLQYTTSRDRVARGQTIVTAGTRSRHRRLRSLFPAGIPIGRVTRVDDPDTDTPVVHVRPFADMHRLEFVQVLTDPDRRRRA